MLVSVSAKTVNLPNDLKHTPQAIISGISAVYEKGSCFC